MCANSEFQVAKEAAPENPDIWTDEDNEIEFTIPKRTPKKTPKKLPEPTSDEAIFAVSVEGRVLSAKVLKTINCCRNLEFYLETISTTTITARNNRNTSNDTSQWGTR